MAQMPDDNDVMVALFPAEARAVRAAHELRAANERERQQLALRQQQTFAPAPPMVMQQGMFAPTMVPGPRPQQVAPPLAPQQVPGLGMVGAAPDASSVMRGIPPPVRSGVPRTAGRAPMPMSFTPPGDPSSHEPVPEGQESYNTPAPASSAIDPNSPRAIYQQADAIRKQAYGLAPDPAVIAEERRKASQNWFMGTMLKAVGGDAFGESGGAVLRQALQRKSELELDPERELARQVRSLEGQALALERQAALSQNAIDKRELQTQAEAARAEQARLQREAIAAQKQIAYAQIAANRSERDKETRSARTFTQENVLRDDFEKQVKDQRLAIGLFPQLEASFATATPTAASDMRGIFRYMKMLDPTSVVRETEFATAQNAAGIPERIRNLYNKAREGTLLSPQQRQQFLNEARSERDTALTFFNQRAGEFASRAQGYNLNPNNVIIGYGPAGAQAPGGQQGWSIVK